MEKIKGFEEEARNAKGTEDDINGAGKRGVSKADEEADERIRELEELRNKPFQLTPGGFTEDGKIALADEWLAKSIKTDSLPAQVWQKIVASVRQFLRKIGIDVKYTTSEVKQLVRRAVIAGDVARVPGGGEELGLVGASESKLSGSMTPEFPTVAAYIHRFSVPSAPSAAGPPNSFMRDII